MFCSLWLRFYEKEPLLACMIGGALLVVPVVPLAALAIDGVILVFTAMSALIYSGASVTIAAAERELERWHYLSLEQECTRREQLLIDERARVAANAPPPPTMHDRLAALRSRHIEQAVAIAMLPVDEPTREALQREQEEFFTEQVRTLMKRKES